MGKHKSISSKRKQRRQKENRVLALVCTIIVVIVLGAVLFLNWYNKPQISAEELEGLWICDSTTSYEFEKDGKGTLYADEREFLFTYKIKRKDVVIDFKDDVIRDCVYGISIDENMLYMEGKKGTTGGQFELEKLVQK